MRSDNEAVGTLYGLTNSERSFALYDRVTWAQSATTEHLLSAALLLKTMCFLHSHISAGRSTGVFGQRGRIAPGPHRHPSSLSREHNNILGNDRWIVGHPAFAAQGAAWCRHGFLTAFTAVISEHRNFWQGKSLHFAYDIREKLKKFPMDDPEIQRLASASGASVQTLEFQLISHINSGRTVHQLEKHSSYPAPFPLKVVGE
jgi:hypothetical protein